MEPRATTDPAPPEIAPIPDDPSRPTWSVMVPAYNPGALLESTLRRVLDQDPGPARMQIAVVDDRSPNGRAREIVARLAPDRIEYHEQPSNVGLASNWNSCIDRARGHWVHILHQDDPIEPGFYDHLGRADRECPGAGMAFCRFAFVDLDGERTGVAEVERPSAGVLDDWAARIAEDQRVQCPAVVVRRSTYEQIGGFRSDLKYMLDWEMWVRIAFRFPVWYEPEVLASWRKHDGNESKRLERLNAQLPDLERAFAIIHAYAPEQSRNAIRLASSRAMRWRYLLEVDRLIGDGRPWSTLKVVDAAYRYEGRARRWLALLGQSRWALKSWLRGPA